MTISYTLGPSNSTTEIISVTSRIPKEIIVPNAPFSFVLQVNTANIGEQAENAAHPYRKAIL